MEPLHWPESFSVSHKPWYKMLFTADKQYKPTIDYVKRQLIERDKPDPAWWGNDPVRFKVAKQVCHRIQERYEWPNDHFIPEDPFDVLFLTPWDDLEVNEVILELEDDFRVHLSDAEVADWQGKTLAAVVDSVYSKL